jgi:hypothetical protein
LIAVHRQKKPMRWALRGAAALLATIAATAPTAAGATTSGLKAIWGPAVHEGVSLFPTYRELGVKIYEERLFWNSVATRRPGEPRNPNDPAYVWPAALTTAVAEAARYHMQVALQIIGAPTWANGGKPWNWVPLKPQDYANFAIAAARRYPSVHLWMIWGEPTRAHNFEPLIPAKPFTKLNAEQRRAPHIYARILDAAYGALKSVGSANVVIGGMTFSGGEVSTQQWIENLRLPDGKPPRFDMYGHNPFTAREPNLADPPTVDQSIGFSDLARLNAMVDRNLGTPSNPKPKLFLSEWTIPTKPDEEFAYWVEPPLQARWIAAGLRIASELPSVYAVGWINLYDEPPYTYGGLIETDGVKKPGFFAWKDGPG